MDLPSHQSYESVVRWYGRSIVASFIGVVLAFGLSKVAPGISSVVPMLGFLPFPVLLGLGLRQMWPMARLRRQDLADGAFAGSHKYLLFLDQQAIAIGAVAFIAAILIGILVTDKH